jgi:hypothetical protein
LNFMESILKQCPSENNPKYKLCQSYFKIWVDSLKLQVALGVENDMYQPISDLFAVLM